VEGTTKSRCGEEPTAQQRGDHRRHSDPPEPSLVWAWGQGLDGFRPESGQHRLASPPLGKETRRRSRFSHGHGGVRGRPDNTVRSTLISRFTLTSPSAPLSWFSLSSVVSGHHQVDHGVARGRYPRSDSRRTGRRRCEASYFPESKSVSDGGRGGGCPSAECASVVGQESSAAVTGRGALPISSDGGSSVQPNPAQVLPA
jgi:hypothetical protein